MTNTSNPPLEIKHNHIDPLILEAVRKIDTVAAKHETKYFLASATAREVILRHVFGRPPGRRTLDIDFGIAVRDWDHFETLKLGLIEQGGFTAHPRTVQRLTYNSVPVSVAPLLDFTQRSRSTGVRPISRFRGIDPREPCRRPEIVGHTVFARWHRGHEGLGLI